MSNFLNKLNKNQGALALLSLICSILFFVFSDKKIVAIILFILFISLLIYTLCKKKILFNFDEIREKAKILFIDDKNCPIATNLSRNNFEVKEVNDITIIDNKDVQWANIIFVDYKGVGKKLTGKKEGLGLIKELKRKYGNKKRYIIYSSEQDFDGIVDVPYIRKNASYDEFISLISSEILKL